MTELERENLALEAARLKQDPTIRLAVATMRMQALEALASMSPDEPNQIRAAQANVRAADDFVQMLEAFIHQGTTRRGPTVA